jgi:hypothetical protein
MTDAQFEKTLKLSRMLLVIRLVFSICIIIFALVYTSWLLEADPEKRNSSYTAWKVWFGQKGVIDNILSFVLNNRFYRNTENYEQNRCKKQSEDDHKQFFVGHLI